MDRNRWSGSNGFSGRDGPDYALVSLSEMYVRLTGNPAIGDSISAALLDDYRDGFEPEVLDRIAATQMSAGPLIENRLYRFWWRIGQEGGLPLRWANGSLVNAAIGGNVPFHDARVRVDEVEKYIREQLSTKHSDTSPLLLQGGGTLSPDQLLFLVPKRALIETRNDGVCDITRYFSVGRVTPQDIINHLDGRENGIFARYGETDEDRTLSLNTHSLRHLLTTELFRQGIADTIITGHFNRRSVAENYTYDHRTLAEQLSAQDLSPEAKQLPQKPRSVAALIKMGKAGGPIVDRFKRLQRDQGDEEAFSFLAAEADGFHATPYGFCVNSFLIEPCGKHLQCFDGCRYLVACLLDRQRANLEKMRDRMLSAAKEIGQRRGGVGRANQLKHAERLVENIEKLLTSSNGDMPFRDGRDLSDRLGHNNGPRIDGVI